MIRQIVKVLLNFFVRNVVNTVADLVASVPVVYILVPVPLFAWFDNNLMKSNADKCHLFFSFNGKSNNHNRQSIIADTKHEMLLVVHLDGDLSFDYHILEICQKASCKICVLVRVKSSISLSKKRTFLNECVFQVRI